MFVFDANMLLNIYRYSPETQKTFLTTLERLKDRIWLPHQAVLEFSKNRSGVIDDQLKAYTDVEKMLDDAYPALEKQLSTFKRHPSISIAEVLASVKSGLDAAKDALAKNKESHPDLAGLDPVGQKLEELIDLKVGPPFTNEKLLNVYGAGELRYRLQQPPGYMDTKIKPGNEKYGDLVLWLQVIEYAKKEHKPIILVTGENKEDWWQKEKGKIISPRPELMNEIHNEAGVGFYLYQGAQFLKYAQEFLKLEDQQAAVQEVEEISRQDEAIENAVNYFVDKDWIGRRVLDNRGAFDNLLLRRASEAAYILENPLTRETIKSAKLFDRTFENPLLRRALEDARAINNPLISDSLEQAKATDSAITRHLEDVSRLVNDPATGSAAEFARMLDNPAIQRVIDTQAAINTPAMAQALEAARSWWSHPLAGWPLPRDINIEISPKRSSELPTSDSSQVRVEVILPDEGNESEAEEGVDVEASKSETTTSPYEFNNFPQVITLTHRADSSHPFETSHRLRRPTNDEWEGWAQSIKRNRSYFSLAEIDEYNADREEDDKASEIWSPSYSEWEANESLYDRILLEIAGVHVDSDDEFPRDQFRALPAEIIARLQFETKSAVLTKLYECYCELNHSSDHDELSRINQELFTRSSSFDVIHLLRKPSEAESRAFRTRIVTGKFAQDEESREIVELHLNLSVAIEFYNLLIVGVEEATVDGKEFSAETRRTFLEVINPVYKLRVLEELFGVRAWYFKVDDILFP